MPAQNKTPNTPLRPKDINAQTHLFGAFNNSETEVSAGWIVRFCQQRGRGWAPISLRELTAYYCQRLGRAETFLFNRLTTDKYVFVDGDEVVLTTKFVAACYKSSPVQ